MAEKKAKAKSPGQPGPVDREFARLLPDTMVRDFLAAADQGDPEAVHLLHAVLAAALRQHTLSPYMIELLAGMHQSIANGVDADVAMLARKLEGAPPKVIRDWRIVSMVDSMLTMRDQALANPSDSRLADHADVTNEEVYRRVAKKMDCSSTTVKRVYLRSKD